MSRVTFSSLLEAYFLDEGWHRAYKKYGSVLAKENYRWKRKVMKRFGPCRKCQFHRELKETDTLLFRIKKSQEAAAETSIWRPI